MPDTSDSAAWIQQRQIAPEMFEGNRVKREAAAAEVTARREELADLLVWGSNYGLDVAHMARMAGISRETAHKLFRQSGEQTLRQQILAKRPG